MAHEEKTEPHPNARHSARFTDDQVREMRRLYRETPMTQTAIAKQFDANVKTVSVIIRRESYRWVTAIVFALLFSSSAAAQYRQPSDATHLARVVVLEAGFDVSEDEASALAFVVLKRAELHGLSLRTASLHSLPMRRCIEGVPFARMWGCYLTTSRVAPRYWQRASWPVARTKFVRIEAHLERLLEGNVADPCPTALHWGEPELSPRDRMIPVCVDREFANRFYCVACQPTTEDANDGGERESERDGASQSREATSRRDAERANERVVGESTADDSTTGEVDQSSAARETSRRS